MFARTVFRELARAGSTRAEILEFVNELVELMMSRAGEDALTGVTEPETHLANFPVLVEALDFEMKRARGRATSVLVVCIDLAIPELIADELARTLNEGIALAMQRGVRTQDTIGRVRGSRYVVIAPGASLGNAETIARRVLQPILTPRRVEDVVPEGIRVSFRAALYDGASASLCVHDEGGRGHPAETGEAVFARLFESSALDLSRVPPDGSPSVTTRAPIAVEDGVVLALGGGAARAAAHVGVLRALRMQGIRIVGVAGTSAGALVGAMFLSGMTDDEMVERFVGFPKTPIYRRMRRLYALYRHATGAPTSAVEYFRRSGLSFLSSTELAAIDDDTFGEFIEHFVGPDRDISTLGTPFSASATDLVDGRSVSMASGPLHAALRASCAVPGLFAPQAIDGRCMIDGSAIGEVPVKAAFSLGAGSRVMAVHLARREQRVSTFQTSAQVAIRASAIVHTELVREQLRHAPELIVAAVHDVGWLEFRRASELVDAGFTAASEYLRLKAEALEQRK